MRARSRGLRRKSRDLRRHLAAREGVDGREVVAFGIVVLLRVVGQETGW
jgi:hypothetical protein